MQLPDHARSKRESPRPGNVAGLAIVAGVVGVLLAVGMAAGYVQAAAPPLPHSSAELTEPPGTRYSALDTQSRIAVPFPHPTRTFTSTPTNTPPACGLLWRPFASPSTAFDTLYGVSALSASDLWAAGSSNANGIYSAMLEHWNGTSWTTYVHRSIPNSELYAVAVISASDVWAVGKTGSQSLVEHWDGSNWSVVSAPNAGPLYGVAAVPSSDAWAVGMGVLHWDGTQWSAVPSPNATTLRAVIALSPNDAWAVGNTIIHWDGSFWSVVYSAGGGTFLGIDAVSATDIWAVGHTALTTPQTLTAHWDGTQWSVVPSPNLPYYDSLNSVSVLSANDVWAAGHVVDGSQTLVQHWDGEDWSIVPSPTIDGNGRFNGVVALAPEDVWAVGSYYDGHFNRTLVGRYNDPCGGLTATPTHTPTVTPTPACRPAWNVVDSPNVGPSANYLDGIAVVSANDIWAVGDRSGGTLTLHWDGAQWSVVPSPSPGTNAGLRGVAAISANDVWAVGAYADSGPQTLTIHWNGTSWTQVPSPSPGGNPSNFLSAVDGVASNDVWAVGFWRLYSPQPLIEHYDGSTWTQVANPAFTDPFNGVKAISADDAWAVGGANTQSRVARWSGGAWNFVACPDVGTLYSVDGVAGNDLWAVGAGGILHWDGTSWAISTTAFQNLYGVAAISSNDVWALGGNRIAHWDGTVWTASPDLVVGSLGAVAGASSMDVWAVGWRSDGSVDRTLVERYYGPCATPTSTPTATGTTTSRTVTPSPTPTGTTSPAIPPTLTRTPTWTGTPAATPCVMPFTDVQPSDYFYEPARYLYCRGVISGYGDGTFRPYNLTTRGQLAKIVVLAEGWPVYLPPYPRFRDVPAHHAFYQYVETAYHQGIISGYSCGPGCLEYRPNNNVTRGQLCKIVALAQGWPLYTPPIPTFRDVPPTDPFYAHVETASSHGIISGYACGVGCLEFRTGNNATRGQISKIVYLAVSRGQGSGVRDQGLPCRGGSRTAPTPDP